MGIILADPYEAPAKNYLPMEKIFQIAISTTQEILDISAEDAVGIIKKTFDQLFTSEYFGDTLSIETAKRRFSRELFILQNPTIESSKIDQFCFRFRTEVALALYPEKMEEFKKFLKNKEVIVWKPNDLMKPKEQGGDRNLVSWITRNCRTADGKTDWKRVSDVLKLIYPSTLDYTEKREPFTRESALSKCREVAQKILESNEYWNPNWIAVEDGEIYNYITGIAEFRRASLRPDLEMRSEKTGIIFSKKVTTSRPNWYAIAEAMGDGFLQKLQLGNIQGDRHEQILRNLEIACEELDAVALEITQENKKNWAPRNIQLINQALYKWFTIHYHKEGADFEIDWKKIIPYCNQNTQSTFSHTSKLSGSVIS